ncbi:MAG: NAD-dependent epimerase/dehydratase family protein [Sulfuricella sp.]|nr:NAD-dependent epimerase/dehydratase family protein [Sulfuricella sp.]
MPMLRTPIVEEDIRAVMAACIDELRALSGKTLLLTGGSGFVGSYLVESVIAFNRAHSGEPCRLLLPTRSLSATRSKWPHFFDVEDVVWFEWDGSSLAPPSDECDYAIHAASPADPASYLHAPMQTMEDIANGTSAVLRYARRAGVRTLLYLSSGAAYGRQKFDVDALAEDDPGAPDLAELSSCYGEAKRYAELLCRTSGVPAVIARLFAFVGPYQDIDGSFAVPEFIRQAMCDKTIRIHSDGSALRTYCYASDLTIGLWKLLLNGKPGELYNVGADAPRVSIRELAETIAGQVGGVEVVVEGATGAGPRSRYIPDTTRFKQFHSARIDLADGLRRTLASYRQSLPVPA